VLDIPAEDIKTKRPIEYPISAELSGRIDFYLNRIRPQIPGARTHDYLWASSRGRPMGDGSIYNSVRRRTRKALGFPVNLHDYTTFDIWVMSKALLGYSQCLLGIRLQTFARGCFKLSF